MAWTRGFGPLMLSKGYLFVHLSDPHLTSLQHVKAQTLLSKRLLGYLSWRMHRRAEHRREVLSVLVSALLDKAPDHIVITGDLTHLGLPSEFLEVSRWLPELGDPTQVTIVPGNHDAYVKEPWAHTFALWDSYMDSDAGSASGEQTGNSVVFPSLRVRGPLALIGLSSACPTAPFFATGSLGKAQLRRLDQLLVTTEEQGLIRTLLIHHPPMTHSVAWRKRLTDSLALRQVLIKRGVELVLHGHAHRFALEYLETSFGKAPVIGVPSASCIGRKPGHRAQFNLYRCNPGPKGRNLEISIWSYEPKQDCFVLECTHTLALPS